MNESAAAAPERKSIAPETGVGTVHVAVTQAERSLRFYRDVLGLELIDQDDGSIRLGVGDKELVVLHPGARGPAPQGTTGLYHFAIVVPTRRELARFIAHLMDLGYPNSPTDHVMTKSDYLWDPDGIGIEVYTETPEDGEWFTTENAIGARDKDGRLRSGRDPIDLEALFSELELEGDARLEGALAAGTKMGHVHLHVRDIGEAVHFWSDLVGFDVMGRSNGFGMAFVSAGGYHHHLGLNTWAGRGAPPPPPGAPGLRHFTIEVPGNDALEEVARRLQERGVSEKTAAGFFTEDPSRNRAHIKVRDS